MVSGDIVVEDEFGEMIIKNDIALRIFKEPDDYLTHLNSLN